MDEQLSYCGIDLHKKYCFITILTQDGEVRQETKLPNDEVQITALFQQIQGKKKIAIEATYNWEWLVDLLQGIGCEVHLANPFKVRIIAEAKIKTDKIDARVLANLLRLDYLPTAYIANQETRGYREYLRGRLFIVHMRTAVKNRIHQILDKRNIVHGYSDLFGTKGQTFLRTLSLPEKTQKTLDTLLDIENFIKGRLSEVKNEIYLTTRQDQIAKLLMTIPGIGQLSALMILHEVGDFNRFSSAKKLAAYAGLVPRLHSSGKRTYSGGITKEGNKFLRWIMIQAAASVVRHKKDYRLMRLYQRICHKKNFQIAVVALAKEMLTIAYHMVQRNQVYNPNALRDQFQSQGILNRVANPSLLK